MLIREARRLVVIVCILLTVGYIGIRLRFGNKKLDSWLGDALSSFKGDAGPAPLAWPTSHTPTSQDSSAAVSSILEDVDPLASHNEVFSVSTKDRKFFYITFGGQKAMNPNIIPHPLREDTWIIVAQKYKGPEDLQAWFSELVCSATFQDDGGALACDKNEPPSTLPIAATMGDKCDGDLAYFSLNVGPHDARVFFGPRAPYALYGSQSTFTCFGQWVQDFRALFPWGLDMSQENRFRLGTELQRPSVVPAAAAAEQLPQPEPQSQSQYLRVEKNWFLFWDRDGRVYAHYDIAPAASSPPCKTTAPPARTWHRWPSPRTTSASPAACQKWHPRSSRCTSRPTRWPSRCAAGAKIHHASPLTTTRSCSPSSSTSPSTTSTASTSRTCCCSGSAPFEVYGVFQKPIWIHGREGGQRAGEPGNQSQMFYVVSMSWKVRGQKYQGYLDDLLFLSFGIEDENTAGIDVVAGGLAQRDGTVFG
ncbi:hypothetical protein PG994_009600 [Apiospora phragmitis]|uniref:Uncharacterized protein n=1 Tax=Apiospora phragmitis TaxID=2905665 RepID=A0ABR1U6M5_9PEZI